jgi:hypothetical protein
MKRRVKRRATSKPIRRKAAPVVSKPKVPRQKFGSPPSGQRVAAVVDPDTGMNKTETAYSQVLERKRLAGEILEWKFEPMKFRLADSTFYTPDFGVQLPDRSLEMIDVKGRSGSGPGGWEDDARVKIKVAAAMHQWFKFVGIAKSGDGWKREEF